MSAERNLLVLRLDSIRLDGGTQIRVCLNEAVVAEYAELIANETHLPPLCVFEDGTDYWLADGFHRWHALKKAGRTEALCHAYRGTRRDALLAAVRANHSHGLRRTNEDKRRAVEIVLADAQWAENTDRWIAEACGVSHPFVATIRGQLVTVTSCQRGGVEVRIGLDGRKRRVPVREPEQAQVSSAGLNAIEAVLRSRSAFRCCLRRINDVMRRGEDLAKGPGGDLMKQRLADFIGNLESAASILRDVTPRARCTECRGSGCPACLMAGYVCGAPPTDTASF